MRDRMLDQIRQRDEDFKYLPDHWQAQKDRRYLLKVIDEIRKEVEKYESTY